jgi:predicted DNA-binding transcriptional regulator YafY
MGCYLGAAKLAEVRLQYTEAGSVLIAAIEGRRLVSIWYDPGVRVVEPYALGYGSDRQLLLRAFQVAGATSSDEAFHWRLFRVDRIRDAKLYDAPFWKPRPEYRRDDRAIVGGHRSRRSKH